jgi:hypothetical protein
MITGLTRGGNGQTGARAPAEIDQRNSGCIHLMHQVERQQKRSAKEKDGSKKSKTSPGRIDDFTGRLRGFGAEPSRPAVDFSLRSIDGQTVTSDSLRGEIVVLAFGASWLPLSRTQLQGVANSPMSTAIEASWFTGSAPNRTIRSRRISPATNNCAGSAQKYGLKVTVLRDHDGVVSKKFGVDQLPSIVILDKEGNMSGGPIGGLDPSGNLAGQLASDSISYCKNPATDLRG